LLPLRSYTAENYLAGNASRRKKPQNRRKEGPAVSRQYSVMGGENGPIRIFLTLLNCLFGGFRLMDFVALGLYLGKAV
jgi:hypothetical protein